MSGRTIHASTARLHALWMDWSISLSEAASRVPMSGRHLSAIAHKMGWPRRPVFRHPEAITDKHELRLMWAAGLSTADIVAALGCHKNTVLRTARKMGLPSRCRGFTGTCTLEQYQSARLRVAMTIAARAEQAAFINAELVDRVSESNWVGIKHARMAA